MRRAVLLLATLAGALALATDVKADPPDVASDGSDGAMPAPVRSLAAHGERSARNLSLVGSIRLGGRNELGIVSAFGDLAFVGTFNGGCPRVGARIVDLSDPSNPRVVATTAGYASTLVAEAKAMRIGTRLVLGVWLRSCGRGARSQRTGLEVYDITRPAEPQLVSFLPLGEPAAHFGHRGLELVRTPTGRFLALLAAEGHEAATLGAGRPGTGDLVIVDISDPEHPGQVGEWGLLEEPALGVPFLLGQLPASQGIDVDASPDGTRAYLSYDDAGSIVLDISDPAAPRFLGRAGFGGHEEGGAFVTSPARGRNVLVQLAFDEIPFDIRFTSSAFAGRRPTAEASFTPRIAGLPGGVMAGEVANVGSGCPAEPYLADPAGKLALIERGGCPFSHKIARADLAGATGVIVYNTLALGDALTVMAGPNPVTLPDGTVVAIEIPAIFVGRTTGELLRGTPPVTASAEALFDGWGFVRLHRFDQAAGTTELATIRTSNSLDRGLALHGNWTPYDQAVHGSAVYVAWGSDGVRVFDISSPAQPTDVGFWNGRDALPDAPPVDIGGVARHRDLILATDRNYGLYVLKHVP